MLAWWRQLAPSGARLHTAAAWDGERLIGLAAAIRMRSGRIDEVVGLAPGMSVRGAVLLHPDDPPAAAAVLAHAFHDAGSPHRYRWPQVARDDDFPALLRDAWPTTLRPGLEYGAWMPVPTMQMPDDGFEAWSASKSSNFRQRIRREGRRMEAKGATMRLVEDPADMDAALAEFHRLHAAKWGARSPLSSVAGDRMMRAAAEALGAQGMRIHLIEVDGAAVSVQVFITRGGELIYWNGGWDPEWAQHSPALVGIVAALEDGFARGDHRLDLGEDDSYDYKTRIADGGYEVTTVTLAPRGPRYLATMAYTAPQRAKRVARTLVRRLPDGLRQRLPGTAA